MTKVSSHGVLLGGMMTTASDRNTFRKERDSYALCKVTLRDDGTIQLHIVGYLTSSRMAFNTVLELNRDAWGDGAQTFYQIEYRPGIDTTIDF
jgi:hypothetical protein